MTTDKVTTNRMSHFRHQKLFSGDISMEESDERGINYPKNGLLGFFGTDLWDMHLLWNMSAHIKNVIIWETVRCFSAWALYVSCAHPLAGNWFHSCIFPPIIDQQQWAGCLLRQAQPSILYQFLSFLMVVTSPSRLSLFKFCLVLASPCIFILFF